MTTPKAIANTQKNKKGSWGAKLPLTKVQSQNNHPLHPPQSKWHDDIGLVVQREFSFKSWFISW
jgi:hypothetical protein